MNRHWLGHDIGNRHAGVKRVDGILKHHGDFLADQFHLFGFEVQQVHQLLLPIRGQSARFEQDLAWSF